MAEIIDLNDDGTESNTTLEPTQTTEPTQQPVDNSVAEPVLPEKYKGKSLDDIIRMHQEAEKLIGKQAQEVGEVRKLADELIKQQLNAKQDTQPTATHNEIDFFEDPAKAINQTVENNPVIRELKEQQEMQIRQQKAAQLQAKFPNFQEIVATEDFANWIKASKVRLDLFAQANNFDFDAATELLDTYTAIRGVQNKQADDTLQKVEATKREQTIKAASVQKGNAGEVGKPIYRRVDLIRLRMTDPERYNAMQDEIMEAYTEGRVK